MRAEAIQKLVGRPVRDTYGRYVGFVVGFSVDTSGELKSMGVDQGSGEFAEYSNDRIVSDSEGFIVIPAWKAESEGLGKDVDGVRKRAKALQELASEGEVPRSLYEEMFSQYSSEAQKIQEAYKSLATKMVKRAQDLDRQRQSLDRFLVTVKVQYRAGEIDEAAYKVASDYCQAMREKDLKERDELERMLKFVTEPLDESAPPASDGPQEPQIQAEAGN